jgi:alkaline phosphatase D
MTNGIGWVFFIFTCLLSISAAYSQTSNFERLRALGDVNRIAFGSCNDQNDAQPLWQDMMKINPDLFIWGGDVIYADWESTYNMASSYEKQFNQPDYQAFKAKTPIIGTWDDHDYAFNNADGSNVTKNISQEQFLNFVEEPQHSLRRAQKGIYTSYDLGTEGRRVKIILLDNRYFKNLDPEAPLMGKTQWIWLENEFKNSKADMHIVMAGLPIFSVNLPFSEEWTQYFSEVQRMLKLIKTYQPKGLLFLSGDKHFASIYENYGQLEFMASGMTHVAPRSLWGYLGTKFPIAFFGLNYGLIDIEWIQSTPKIRLAIRGTQGRDIFPSSYLWKSGHWEKI